MFSELTRNNSTLKSIASDILKIFERKKNMLSVVPTRECNVSGHNKEALKIYCEDCQMLRMHDVLLPKA